MLGLQFGKLLLLLYIVTLCDAKKYKCEKTLSCGCGSSDVEINARIIHGEEAIPHSWSMIVSLRHDFLTDDDLKMHVCGGTILTNSYILTAASCVDGLEDYEKLPKITIAAGIHRRSEPHRIIRQIDQIIIHPNWTGAWAEGSHDIALLHLAEPLDFEMDSFITRTCLPPRLDTEEELIQYPADGTTLSAVGWGRTEPFGDVSDILRQIAVYSIYHRNSVCADIINDTKKQFCAGLNKLNTGPCYGDIGGPIFQWMNNHWVQVGITSFRKNGCKTEFPVVYTRVAYYHDWIETHIHNKKSITEETPLPLTITPSNITEESPTIYSCDKYVVPCGCGRRNVEFTPSIIPNDWKAIPYSWSMIVSIGFNGTNEHLCSGTILTESYILTSASCVAHRSSFGITITAGIYNLSDNEATYRKVDSIFIHPDYNRTLDSYANDVAILHISELLNFDNDPYISRTCLTKMSESLPNPIYYPSVTTRLAVIGWGYTDFGNSIGWNLLQQAQVYAISGSDQNCHVIDTQHDIKFCAEIEADGKVPCIGDSGSPIFEWIGDRWQQVGIVSSPNGCVGARTFGIYARLVSYYNWIQSIIYTDLLPPPTTTTITTPTSNTTLKPPILYQCNRTSSCGCGATPVVLTPTRIVGGEHAIDYSWPMIVSLRYNDPNDHRCGGTILSNSYVLTAAHCLFGYVSDPPIDVLVAVGMTNLLDSRQIRHAVDRIYIHPNYTGTEGGFRHDIALMHINQSFTIEEDLFLRKSCIHRVDPPILNNQYIKNGTSLAVIGWGTTEEGLFYTPDLLQQTEVFAIDNEHPDCKSSINDSETQFCAGLFEGGKDSCQGDSGGPIFKYTGQYWEQVGVVSYGFGCARPGSPGVYTRLSYYYNWINEILKNDSEHSEPQFPPYIPNITTATTSTMPSNAYNNQRNIHTFAILLLLIIMII